MTNRASSLYCSQLLSLDKIGCASEEQFQTSLIVLHSAYVSLDKIGCVSAIQIEQALCIALNFYL